MFVRALLLVLVAASPVGAATLHVNAGGNLQGALDTAQPGDEIVLEAGATFTGEFVLPRKPEGPVITVRSSAALPDRRITPADAPLLPRIGSGSTRPALAGRGARNWRLDGIQFLSTLHGMYNIIHLHDNASNITFDRLLIVAGPDGQRRAIAGNGARITLTRSHMANIFKQGDESTGFGAWDGPGPFTIRDNYIEAASINILFGGADSSSPEHIPADIVVEHNHFTKRSEWRGRGVAIKNLFELKSAIRVRVRHNLLEQSWGDAQAGFGVVLTSNNDNGGSPWARVEDVVFEHNVMRDVERGFSILGTSYGYPTMQGTNLVIRNNLVVSSGEIFSIGGEVGTLTFDHNTFVNGDAHGRMGILYRGQVNPTGGGGFRDARYAVAHLTFTNNLAYDARGGLFGDGVGSGMAALKAHVQAYTWTHNVLAERTGDHAYPSVTWHPSAKDYRAQFNADHTLVPGSRYRNAGSDGQDVGRLTGSIAPQGTGLPDGAAPGGGTAPASLVAPRNLRVRTVVNH